MALFTHIEAFVSLVVVVRKAPVLAEVLDDLSEAGEVLSHAKVEVFGDLAVVPHLAATHLCSMADCCLPVTITKRVPKENLYVEVFLLTSKKC